MTMVYLNRSIFVIDYFNNRLIVAALFICESLPEASIIVTSGIVSCNFCFSKGMDSQGRPVVVCDNGTGVCTVICFMLTESVVFYSWHAYETDT